MEPDRFVSEVREFLGLLGDGPGADSLASLTQVHARLASIYAGALSLPAPPPIGDQLCTDPNPDAHLLQIPHVWDSVLGPLDGYWECYEPFGASPEQPVLGTTVGELGEIAHDLAEGLACWDAGRKADALWTWHFGLETHWGRHAVSVLRVLHLVVYDRGLPSPSEGTRGA